MHVYSRLAGMTTWFENHPFLASLTIAAALVLSAVLVQNVGDPSSGRQRRTANVTLMLLAGVVLALGGALFLVGTGRWGYLLAILPGATIARHAVYMRLIRRRAMAAPVAAPAGLRRTARADDDAAGANLELKDPGLAVVFARARQMHDLDFAPDTLAVRFGVPALLATFIGIGVFEFLRTTVGPPQLVHAAWFGAAGAMVYVLLYLGQRGFRNDITTGAALWSAVVLAVGPVLAAVVALVWVGDASTPGTPAPTAWTHDALYFVAGMSPRHVASAVEEAVRRLWLSRTPTTQVQSRLQPLGQLRGITPAIEDRLAEEGIADVQGMAMADPLKLFRGTSFDKRQILSWMDEAMLITWLPDQWVALQKVGVTGAIDLMAHSMAREAGLRKVLKGTAKMDDAAVDTVILAGTVLNEDAQLRLVWALYQFDEETHDSPAANAELAEMPALMGAWTGSLAVPALGWLLGGVVLALGGEAADDTHVLISHIAGPVAVLAATFAITLTARWPWSKGRLRFVPGLAAAVLAGVAWLTWGALSPLLAGTWPLQGMLLAAGAMCLGVFLVGALTSGVGGILTVDFPHGAPADSELWVNGQLVPIVRAAATPTTCAVAGRWVPVVVRSGGSEQRRLLNVHGQRSPRLSMPLRASVALQLTPAEAVPIRCWVDGLEVNVGALSLWPRAVAYTISVEAAGFLPGAATLTVTSADVLALAIQLQPRPQAPPPAPVDVPPTPTVVVAQAGVVNVGAIGQPTIASPPETARIVTADGGDKPEAAADTPADAPPLDGG